MKTIKSTPKSIFFNKNVFWKIYHVSKKHGDGFDAAHIQSISQNKSENQASRLGVESRIVNRQKQLWYNPISKVWRQAISLIEITLFDPYRTNINPRFGRI